jgi:hypothetical protein
MNTLKYSEVQKMPRLFLGQIVNVEQNGAFRIAYEVRNGNDITERGTAITVPTNIKSLDEIEVTEEGEAINVRLSGRGDQYHCFLSKSGGKFDTTGLGPIQAK